MCCSNTPSRAAGRCGCARCWRACRANRCARSRSVSKRRAEALPYGAVVLERLLLAGDIKDVVISAYGLREGLVLCAACRRKSAPRIR